MRHHGFLKVRNFNCRFGSDVQCVSPCQISYGQAVAEIWPFLDFKKWRPSAIFYLVYACLDHTRSGVGGLYRSAKFGCNRRCICEDMRLSILCALAFEMPIHATL